MSSPNIDKAVAVKLQEIRENLHRLVWESSEPHIKREILREASNLGTIVYHINDRAGG